MSEEDSFHFSVTLLNWLSALKSFAQIFCSSLKIFQISICPELNLFIPQKNLSPEAMRPLERDFKI